MRRYKPTRSLRYLVFAVTIAVAACVALLLVPPYRKSKVELRVSKGTSLSVVSRDLKNARIIPSSKIFTLYMRIVGADKSIKPGLYQFDPLLPPVEVAKKLIHGDIVSEKIVIPEGRTAKQIALLLEEHGIVSSDTFIKHVNDAGLAASLGIPASSCEGYLYPDTYFLEKNSSPDDIIRLMVNNFRETIKKITNAHPKVEELSPQALYQKVILASIVEREYRLPEDAPIIASVFYNRLAKQMPLQSCATVVYVLTDHLGRPHPSVVYYNDLKIKDVYNTYIHKGLPPGPISNPGEESLRAALYPAATNYLYFRLDDSGSSKHRFSRTLEEHNDAALIPKGL